MKPTIVSSKADYRREDYISRRQRHDAGWVDFDASSRQASWLEEIGAGLLLLAAGIAVYFLLGQI